LRRLAATLGRMRALDELGQVLDILEGLPVRLRLDLPLLEAVRGLRQLELASSLRVRRGWRKQLLLGLCVFLK